MSSYTCTSPRARGQQLIGGNWESSPRDLPRDGGSQTHSRGLFAFLRVCARKAIRLLSIKLYLLSYDVFVEFGASRDETPQLPIKNECWGCSDGVSRTSSRLCASGKSGRAQAFKQQNDERVLVAVQKQLCAQEGCRCVQLTAP